MPTKTMPRVAIERGKRVKGDVGPCDNQGCEGRAYTQIVVAVKGYAPTYLWVCDVHAEALS